MIKDNNFETEEYPEKIDGYVAPVGAGDVTVDANGQRQMPGQMPGQNPVNVEENEARLRRLIEAVSEDDNMQAEKEELENKPIERRHIPGFVCFLLGAICTIVIGILVTLVGFPQIMKAAMGAKGVSYSSEEKLNSLRNIMEKYYLHPDEVTDERLEEGMYKGMVDSLGDPYTVYYTEDEYKALMESTSGSFDGVGLYLSQDPNTMEIIVSKPMENTPAEEAGILAEDVLIKVNDEDIREMELSLVVTKVKGISGSSVKLTFLREGKEMEFEVKRAKIETPTVKHEMKDADKGIGYIYIGEFDEVTYQQFMMALEDLKSQGMKSLIIDLRDNPGGNLNTVCDICDELLPEGLIVYCEDNKGERREYNSVAEQSFTGDMVVLVNGNSASASEIMTGALKDYGLAKIVGTTTFGKGIVQTVLPLGDGTAIKITIQDYFTPKGNNIHKVGIEPDVEVELDIDAYKKDGTDNQLNKALEILGNN